jgi:hypothetical protein
LFECGARWGSSAVAVLVDLADERPQKHVRS